MARRFSPDPPATESLIAEVRSLTRPLRTPADLGPLLNRIGNARVVLLGEASHGSHEFYTWRAEITRRLIEQKGFNFVAVEGDWPDCYKVNRYVKGYPGSARTAEQAWRRFAAGRPGCGRTMKSGTWSPGSSGTTRGGLKR